MLIGKSSTLRSWRWDRKKCLRVFLLHRFYIVLYSSPSLVESHLFVVRDVSKLDCKVWPKLRTFQVETPAETPLLVVATRWEAFKRTRRQLRNVDVPSNNRPAYPFSTYTHRVLFTITHLLYRFDRMSIRQSFVCYLVLPPARQSATSGVNMRSTLGKSLLREEVHETTSRMDTWGVRCHRGIGYCFWGEDMMTTTRRNR